MQKSKVHPPVESLNDLLTYKNGKLYWKERPVEHFKNNRGITWNKRFGGKEAGVLNRLRHPVWVLKVDYISCLRSHVVWAMHYGEWPFQIDHKNRISTDDRIENLRIATTQQNAANRKKRADNTSGYKGVTKYKHKPNTWTARIEVNGKTIQIGLFDCPKKAHDAYVAESHKYFGEYAYAG